MNGEGDVHNQAEYHCTSAGRHDCIDRAAFADYVAAVPGPIIGAGLPALAILGGGYWLVKKLRRPR